MSETADASFVAGGPHASEHAATMREPHALHAPHEPHALGCPFCERRDLELTLATTDHFYLLADHAPLIEGHLLIVPHGHYACYGAVPAPYEAEFAALKRRVARFLATAYHAPTFFEHGVFRQTVFHAHLHALPFGVTPLDLPARASAVGGRGVRSLADVRAWYAERGHYFYLEEATAAEAIGEAIGEATGEATADVMGAIASPAITVLSPASATAQRAPDGRDTPSIIGEAAIFPPDMNAYGEALAPLWRSGGLLGAWRTPHERFEQRGPMLRRVGEAWRAFVANGG